MGEEQMIITYLRDQDKYVNSTGKQVSVQDHTHNFYQCEHDFRDVGRYGETIGANGKKVPAVALQCFHCSVYEIVERAKK